MRILFLGSGAFACPCLERLAGRPGDMIVGVVAQPDRPAGRGLAARSCPAAELARRLGLPLRTPDRVNAPEEAAALTALRPDLVVVAAYGQLLKPHLLALAPMGAINVHPSLLPRYRGAAPIQWAIANGDTETGVTVQFMVERMDAGDIILVERAPVLPDDTAGSLEPRLARLGAELLDRVLDLFQRPPVPRTPQDEGQATYARKLTREDGRLDWRLPAASLHNRIRGFHPWPGCFTLYGPPPGRVLKVHAARVEEGRGEPGRVLEIAGEGPLVATGDNALRLLTVQPEGRPIMDGSAFCRGHGRLLGDRLA